MFSMEPLWRHEATRSAGPAVDAAETDKAYALTGELPGPTEKDVEVKRINDGDQGRSRRTRRKKRRTITFPSTAMASSSAASDCRRESTPTR